MSRHRTHHQDPPVQLKPLNVRKLGVVTPWIGHKMFTGPLTGRIIIDCYSVETGLPFKIEPRVLPQYHHLSAQMQMQLHDQGVNAGSAMVREETTLLLCEVIYEDLPSEEALTSILVFFHNHGDKIEEYIELRPEEVGEIKDRITFFCEEAA